MNRLVFVFLESSDNFHDSVEFLDIISFIIFLEDKIFSSYSCATLTENVPKQYSIFLVFVIIGKNVYI